MAKKTTNIALVTNAWTQLTTAETNVIVQNNGSGRIKIAIADALGDFADVNEPGHTLGPMEGFQPPTLSAGLKVFGVLLTGVSDITVTKF